MLRITVQLKKLNGPKKLTILVKEPIIAYNFGVGREEGCNDSQLLFW
jgi:hypothetical protein